MDVCSVCSLLGHSDYLNVGVLPSLEKLAMIVLAYISFIIIKPLHKLSFINPHNNPGSRYSYSIKNEDVHLRKGSLSKF